jgi:hypothetical protein
MELNRKIMDIAGIVSGIFNALSLLNAEAGSSGPPNWSRRHKTLLKAVTLLFLIPPLLLFLPLHWVLIAGGVYLICVLLALAVRPNAKPSPGMRFCECCGASTSQASARCEKCFSQEALAPATASKHPGIEGWTVDIFSRAQTRHLVVAKVEAMDLPIIDGGHAKVTVGPFSSQREASKVIRVLRRTHNLEGYLAWVSAND